MKSLSLVLLLLAPGVCRAQSAEEYLAAGYHVVLDTSLTGVFAGCAKGGTLTFADGSQFVCNHQTHSQGYAPRALLLQNAAADKTAMVVAGRALDGTVTRIGTGGRAVRIFTTAEDPGPAPSGNPGNIRPVGIRHGILGSTDVQNQLHTRLNDAQADPVDLEGRIRPLQPRRGPLRILQR